MTMTDYGRIRRIDKNDIRGILRTNAFRIKNNSSEESDAVRNKWTGGYDGNRRL
jgi:hypothetical protein